MSSVVELVSNKPIKEEFVQENYVSSKEWKEVKKISERFFRLLSDPKIIERIDEVNQPNISSHLIQDVITEESEKLGFSSERNGLFSNYKNSKLRPDFYKKIFDTGIIIEVEKGQTTQNNNDLKDFWKCHICEEVNYLFLFVPQVLIQNEEDRWRRSKRPFPDVCKHMSSFFEPQNYTNVRGVVVYGY